MVIGIDASRISLEGRTGTENYSYYVVKNLARIDTKNSYRLYFRAQPDKKFWSELTYDNPNFSYHVISWPRLWTQGGLAWELWRHPVDVCFIPAHTMPILHRPAQKFVVTIHGLEYMFMPEYEKFPHKLYLTKSTEFVSRFADHIVSVSGFTKKSLLEHGWGATEDRITVIPEGVDTTHFYPRSQEEIFAVKKKYHLAENYLFFISTIQPRKNVPRLVEAFAQVKESLKNGVGVFSSGPETKNRSDLQLVLAGSPGWKFEEVADAIAKYGLEDDVKVVGRVPDEDVPALYSGAQASVYPSLVEGFGLPVLESMACGTPCVVADTGALPEVAGNAGVLVVPQNVSSIAQGILTVVSNQKVHDGLVQEGLEQIKRFTWEATAQALLRVFTKTL